jgi:hypothetical protein
VNVCLVLVGSRCVIGTSAGHVKRFSEGADADGTAIAKVRGALGGGTAIREGMDRKWSGLGFSGDRGRYGQKESGPHIKMQVGRCGLIPKIMRELT